MEPSQPPPLQPPQPQPHPQPAPPSRSWKVTLGVLAAVFAAGLAAGLSCKPNHVKDTLETTKLVESQKATIQSMTESMTSLKETVSAYEKNKKVRRTQKPALDGKGDPIRDAKGDPVILETVTTISSESGSSRETLLAQQLREALLTITTKDLQIDAMKKTHEETRGGGIDILAGFATDTTKAGHLGFPPAFGFLKSAAQVEFGPAGEFRLMGLGGLHF